MLRFSRDRNAVDRKSSKTLTTKSIIIAICLCIALGIGGVTVVALRPASAKPIVSIRFAGLTNDLSGCRWAGFTISNGNSWLLNRSSHYTIGLPNGNRWIRFHEGWAGGSILSAGATEALWIVAPTNQNVWGATFTFRKDEGTLYLIVTELLLEAQKLGLRLNYRRRSSNYAFSCEVVEE
jgi:hypothetical protein